MTPRIETEALLALAEPSRPDFEARNADLIIRLETDAGGRSTHTSRTCARKWHELKALAEGKVALQPLAAEVLESRLVIDHLGDLLAWQTARAEIERLRARLEDRIHDC